MIFVQRISVSIELNKNFSYVNLEYFSACLNRRTQLLLSSRYSDTISLLNIIVPLLLLSFMFEKLIAEMD